jgi:hypothetical protein
MIVFGKGAVAEEEGGWGMSSVTEKGRGGEGRGGVSGVGVEGVG